MIAGIEIPVLSWSSRSATNGVASGQALVPYSPFLAKLPKTTKITIFHRNTDLDSEPTLAFDGSLISIVESKSYQGQATVTLGFQGDGQIWIYRKKNIFAIEHALSLNTLVRMQQQQQEVSYASARNIIDTSTIVLRHPGIKGDGCKAGAMYLTTRYVIGESDPKNFNAVLNGESQSFTANGFTTFTPEKLNLTPYLDRYLNRYRLPFKVAYIPAPQAWKDAIISDTAWNIVTKQLNSFQGDISYWTIATFFINQMGCEVQCIPDATLSSGNSTPVLCEYLIKPKSIFGRIPRCNIIFPDQVLSKVFVVNHGADNTRVITNAQMVPTNTSSGANSGNQAAPGFWAGNGPHNLAKGYFQDFSINGIGSKYEQRYGTTAEQIGLNDAIIRYLSEDKKEKELEKLLNHEFLITHCNKFSLQIEVVPDVTIVPGMSVAILDEDGNHLIAYCTGVARQVDHNGRTSISLNLTYPRDYSWKFEASVWGDPLSDGKQDEIFARFTGTSLLDTKNYIQELEDYFKEWNEKYQRDSRKMRNDTKQKLKRKICTITEFIKFFGGTPDENVDFNDPKILNKLPESIVNMFDSEYDDANLSSAKYRWTNKFSGETLDSYPVKPAYDNIGEIGEMFPSTFVTGIIDCHLKYIRQIGNQVTV